MRIIDLTFLQNARRKSTPTIPNTFHPPHCQTQTHTTPPPQSKLHPTTSEYKYELAHLSSKLRMDTPGPVFHMLWSMLICPIGGSHCASLWNDSYTNKSISAQTCSCKNQVIGTLLHGNPPPSNTENTFDTQHHPTDHNIQQDDEYYYDKLEQTELEQFLTFQTGDASSPYLKDVYRKDFNASSPLTHPNNNPPPYYQSPINKKHQTTTTTTTTTTNNNNTKGWKYVGSICNWLSL